MIQEEVQQTISEAITTAHPEVFVVDIDLKRGKKNVLNIKVDTDKGISLSTCSEISRELGLMLEENEFFDFPYVLEVSSPGVGSPLKLHRQYVQNVNRYLEIVLQDHTHIKGKLQEVDETSILLEPLPTKRGNKSKGKKKSRQDAITEKRILFTDIKESKVIILF